MQVFIPSLHVSLGLFYRLFRMFENVAHEIDIIMAITLGHLSSGSAEGGVSFQEHIKRLCTVTNLREEADDMADSADFYDSLVTWRCLEEDVDEDDLQIQNLREEARRTRPRAQELVIIAISKCVELL